MRAHDHTLWGPSHPINRIIISNGIRGIRRKKETTAIQNLSSSY